MSRVDWDQVAVFLSLSAQNSRSSGTWTALGQFLSSEVASITQLGLDIGKVDFQPQIATILVIANAATI